MGAGDLVGGGDPGWGGEDLGRVGTWGRMGIGGGEDLEGVGTWRG